MSNVEIAQLSLVTLPATDLIIQNGLDRTIEMPSSILGSLGDYFVSVLECQMPMGGIDSEESSSGEKKRIWDVSALPGLYDLLSCLHMEIQPVTTEYSVLKRQRHCYSPLKVTVLFARCRLFPSQEVQRYIDMHLAAKMVHWPRVASEILRHLFENLPTDSKKLHLLYSFAREHKHANLCRKIANAFLEEKLLIGSVETFSDHDVRLLFTDVVGQIKAHNGTKWREGRSYKRRRDDDDDASQSEVDEEE